MRVAFATLLLAWVALPANAADEADVRAAWNPNAFGAPRPVAKALADPAATSTRPEKAPLMNLKPGASCGASEFEICFDSSGRITVPGAKRFLPVLPGLKPERLTVKRSGVTFGYSF